MELILLERLTPLSGRLHQVCYLVWKQVGIREYGEINHGSGYLTRYAHNKENLAALGQKVTKGEAIALLGSTGMSTGPCSF